MKKSIIIIVFLISAMNIFAQSSCERNLNEARSDYANGNLYAIPGKIGDCLENGFTKTEKIDALQLLTLTYININQQEKARKTFIELLNIQTDYQVKKNIHPPELYSLYSKIDTDIKYFIGLTFGLNYNTVLAQTNPNNNTNPLGTSNTKYSGKISIPQVGVQFMYPFQKTIWLGAELQYQNHKFGYAQENIYSDQDANMVTYESSNNGVNLNIGIRYMKDYYAWKPFLELTTMGRVNISYDVSTYKNNYYPTVEDEIIIDASIYDSRAAFNFSAGLNIGTMIKLGEYYGEIKIGASNYFFDHLNKSAREDSDRTTFLHGMVIKENTYTNLVYQINFTFNLPFFDFK